MRALPVVVRRLSRKTDKTNSPERQGNQILGATVDAGGHIIACADDWEVSGATDPLTPSGGRSNARYAYECTARTRGIRTSAECKPAPAIALAAADALVSEWFLARYGAGEVIRKIYDPGTGHAAQIAELEATRTRLRQDHQAGLYDDADDAEWFRTEYRRLGEEIAALKALPERKPGMRLVPMGRTIAQEWDAADNVRRREMLAEFEVRAVLHPTGHDPRVAIAGMEISPDGFEMTG